MDLDRGGAVGEGPAPGPRHLEARQDDAVARHRQLVLEVVQDAAALGHPGRGDDDAGASRVVELDRLADVVDQLEPARVERVVTFGQLATEVAPGTAGRSAVDLEGGQRHGAVDVHRNVRDAPVDDQLPDLAQQQRGAVDREGWHQRHPAAGQRPSQYVGQLVDAVPLVLTVAVGRLHDHDVGCTERLRGPQQRVVWSAQVPAEDQSPAGDGQGREPRSEDVSRAMELDGDVADLPRFGLRDRSQQLQGTFGVRAVVQRPWVGVPRQPALPRPTRFLFLEVRGIA